MRLKHKFPDPQLNLSLEVFLRMLEDSLDDQLLSVGLFGSVVFDDLCPGYGDLDFVAILKDDPSEDLYRELVDLRKPLRSGDYGIYCHMLEGPFLPVRMLDPTVEGSTVCWGTGGERHWTHNRLGLLVHRVIKEMGVTIYGAGIRALIPEPSWADQLDEMRQFGPSYEFYLTMTDVHKMDYLLTAARLLLLLKENRLSSKTEAADWGYAHAHGAWREFLPTAKKLRRNPSLATSAESVAWLEGLSDPIVQASEELATTLACLNPL